MTVARAGLHTGQVVYAYSNFTPSSARASMFGVLHGVGPYAPTAERRCWSVKMKMMLGRVFCSAIFLLYTNAAHPAIPKRRVVVRMKKLVFSLSIRYSVIGDTLMDERVLFRIVKYNITAKWTTRYGKYILTSLF
jgi:hypothetical protein